MRFFAVLGFVFVLLCVNWLFSLSLPLSSSTSDITAQLFSRKRGGASDTKTQTLTTKALEILPLLHICAIVAVFDAHDKVHELEAEGRGQKQRGPVWGRRPELKQVFSLGPTYHQIITSFSVLAWSLRLQQCWDGAQRLRCRGNYLESISAKNWLKTLRFWGFYVIILDLFSLLCFCITDTYVNYVSKCSPIHSELKKIKCSVIKWSLLKLRKLFGMAAVRYIL